MRNKAFVLLLVVSMLGAAPTTQPVVPSTWAATSDAPRSVLEFLADAPRIGEKSRTAWSTQVVQLKQQRQRVVASPVSNGTSEDAGGTGMASVSRLTPNLAGENEKHQQIAAIDKLIIDTYSAEKASKTEYWLPSEMPADFPVGSYMIVPDGTRIIAVDKEKSTFVSRLDEVIYGLNYVDTSGITVGSIAPRVGFCQVVGRMVYRNSLDKSVVCTAYSLVPVDLRLYIRPLRIGKGSIPVGLISKIKFVIPNQRSYAALLVRPVEFAESSSYQMPDDPLTTVDDSVPGTVGTGPDFVGPRGGVYHYSDSGGKVYSSHGGGHR